MCSNTGSSGTTNKTLDTEQHLKSDEQEVFVSFYHSEFKEQCSVNPLMAKYLGYDDYASMMIRLGIN